MPEAASAYLEKLSRVDVKNDGIQDGESENRIKNLAKEYTLRNKGALSAENFITLVDRIESLLKRQDIDKIDILQEFEKTKRDILKQTKEAVSTVRPLSLSDVHSPAGLSHYIDASGDETMKILEDAIGLDDPSTVKWQAKILLLTAAYTTIEVGKSFADILKFGESTAEGVSALDRQDLNTLEKTWEITKGVGADGLRALAIAGVLKPLISQTVKILSKIQLPKNLLVNLYANLTAPRGYGALHHQRWAIGNITSTNRPRSWIIQQTKHLVSHNDGGEILHTKWGFDKASHNPVVENLESFRRLREAFSSSELTSNTQKLNEFSKTLENFILHIQKSRWEMSKVMVDEYFLELRDLKKDLNRLLDQNKNNPLGLAPLRTVLENDLESALRRLKPELYRPIEP